MGPPLPGLALRGLGTNYEHGRVEKVAGLSAGRLQLVVAGAIADAELYMNRVNGVEVS